MFEYIKGTLQYKGIDYCVIDVNGVGFRIFASYITISNIGNIGDAVTLLGRDGDEIITMEELGDLSERFNYEFACLITPRVPRVYYK